MALRALLPVLALFAVAISGCSGDDDGAGSPTPSGDPSPLATATPSATAAGDLGWTSLAPVPSPRSEVAVAELGGLIYVIGGFDGSGTTTATVEVYDPATDSWIQVAPLPAPRHPAAAIS